MRSSYAFADDRPVKLRTCDCAGCTEAGDYRAPRGRDQLNEYYWFCLTHVRDYNSRWDFFSGMSAAEIEGYIRAATVWERPTWPMGDAGISAKDLRTKAMHDIFGDSDPAPQATKQVLTPAAREALLILELDAIADFATLKAQYRALVKRYHPDANGGSREAEEKFKQLNHAFTVLRSLFGDNDNNV